MYGTAASDDRLTSISVAQNPNGSGPGFIIGGTTDYNGSIDYWLMKTDPTGGVIWTNTYDYGGGSGNTDECWDVLERFNTKGDYEYYAVGTTTNGTFNAYDVVVIKTDDWGNGVAGGEFTYNTGLNDFCNRLDQFNGTPFDGLSMYGSNEHASIGGSDVYVIKSYFNGISGCNESFSTPVAVLGPGLYSETPLNNFDNFVDFILSGGSSPILDNALCATSFDPDGSNAHVAPAQPKGDKQAIVSPNPMVQGSPVAMVELEVETDATVQVSIFDMLGKQYYNGQFTLVKGNNQLPVNVAGANMAAGMYTVKISGANINKNILLMIK